MTVMTRQKLPAFAKKFGELVISSGKTQTEIAKKLGTSQPVISQYINGRREPDSLADLVNISRYFKVTLYELTGLESLKDIEKDAQKGVELTAEQQKILDAYESLDENDWRKRAIEDILLKRTKGEQ